MQLDGKNGEKSQEVAGRSNVSEQHLREFIEAYRIEFDEELSPAEASVLLTQLAQFYLHISRPLLPEEFGKNMPPSLPA